jgi:GAF domain-containing protein
MKTYEFRDVPFMSARDKELVLKAWVRFLRNGLRFQDFPRRLYEHLHLHCQFIAHYDRAGFYRTYFEEGEDTVLFLSQFDKRGEGRSVEYGRRSWGEGDYGDLARAMMEEVSPHIPKLIKQAQVKQREADIAEAQRLVAKHGHELRL